MAKRCSKCKEIKTTNGFHRDKTHKDGRKTICKKCHCQYLIWYKKQNLTKDSEWKKSNPHKVALHNKKYYQNHKEYCCKMSQQWKKEHPEQTKEQGKRHMRKYLAIPRNRLSRRMGCAMRKCLGGLKNHRSWQSLVGYNLGELRKHLEKQFTKGMSWGNYGKWHIDHIRPIASFDFIKPEDIDFQICWALENLQPLWAKENISKGAREMPK